MKFTRIGFVGLLLLAVSFFTVSCDKDVETSNLTLDNSQKANIVVHIYAELDKSKLGYEEAPDGTKVFILIENSEFNSTADGIWMDTVRVKNGKIEVQVPTNSDGVDVEVRVANFIAQQKQGYGSSTSTLASAYSGDVTLSDILPGETRYDELNCSDDSFSNEVEVVSRKFKINAITNVDDGSEKVSGVDVTFYNSEFSVTVKSDSEGVVEVELPKGVNDAKAEFASKKKWDAVETGTKTYRYRTSVNSYSESSPVVAELNFGGGDLFE